MLDFTLFMSNYEEKFSVKYILELNS